ncbi:response regulator transcription factor [Aestuariispira insulae]|uniref:Response regulator receiver domain-containing protein n=1 Tax=Aestuariispira insulae TaxID=1461337 RepID=A0A3D9HXL1_9PROT|nr:response regulator transcription factor [Aestuariispira insulae]RED54243.1 response regulator receiver domain-containing protein [Aestuariispira insulae]
MMVAGSREKKVIVYIEDVVVNGVLMEMIARRIDRCELHRSETVGGGLDMIDTLNPEIVLVDVNMLQGELDGTVSRLVRLKNRCSAKLLAIVDDTEMQDTSFLKKLEIQDYIKKPFRLAEVVSTIDGLFSQFEEVQPIVRESGNV